MGFSTERMSKKELFVCNVVTLNGESPGGTAGWKEEKVLYCLMAAGRINPQQRLLKHCAGKSRWLKVVIPSVSKVSKSNSVFRPTQKHN